MLRRDRKRKRNRGEEIVRSVEEEMEVLFREDPCHGVGALWDDIVPRNYRGHAMDYRICAW